LLAQIIEKEIESMAGGQAEAACCSHCDLSNGQLRPGGDRIRTGPEPALSAERAPRRRWFALTRRWGRRRFKGRLG
jgi:hypothetical protein